MPRPDVPLLILLGVIWIERVGLAAVPRCLGEGLSARRKRRDDACFVLPGLLPQECRRALDPVRIPPPVPGMGIVGGQFAHQLDSTRVLLEHLLSFWTLDVVAGVGFLLGLVGRRARAFGGLALDAGQFQDVVRR